MEFKARTTRKPRGYAFDYEWVSGDIIHSGGKTYIHPTHNIVDVNDEIGERIVMHEVIPETICAPTGAKDKNGVPIFQQDIVEDELGNDGVILYGTDEATFLVGFDGICEQLAEECTCELKVVGNRYGT